MSIPKDIAEAMIEELIIEGEKLLLDYQKFDNSIRSEVDFCEISYSNFPSIGKVNTIYYSINKRNKYIEIRVYEAVKWYWVDPNFYSYRYSYSDDELLNDTIKSETATKIIGELSLNSTVLFSVFNLEKYKTWALTCEQKLSKIGEGVDWFKKAKKPTNILNPNPDKNILDSFKAQITALKNTRELILKSTFSEQSSQTQGHSVIHMHATNSTVNINSPNSNLHSNNTSNTNLFNDIKSTLENELKDEDLKKSVIPLVSDLEKSVGSTSYKDKLLSFMSHTATCMTILGPFIPELVKLST